MAPLRASVSPGIAAVQFDPDPGAVFHFDPDLVAKFFFCAIRIHNNDINCYGTLCAGAGAGEVPPEAAAGGGRGGVRPQGGRAPVRHQQPQADAGGKESPHAPPPPPHKALIIFH
jgi:hypothetical protein